ncbi:hypothetical protein [Xanthomonas phage X1]|nr:hypothetical protein [Xanthomonas phage X1]
MFKFFGDHYGLLECKKALAMNERTSDAVKWLIKSDLFRI